MVLMRKGWAVTPLARVAALDTSRRFTFYDQVRRCRCSLTSL